MLTPSGTTGVSSGSSGRGFNAASGGSALLLPTSIAAQINASKEATLLLVMQGGTTGNQGFGEMDWNASEANHYPYAGQILLSCFNGSRWVNCPSVVDLTKPHTLVIQSKNGSQRATQNNKVLATASLATDAYMEPSASPALLGGVGWTYSGSQPLALFWSRYLSDAEVTAAHENPWQVFESRARRVFAGTSSGGAAALAAAASAVVSSTAALNTSIKLAAAGVGVSTSTASLTTAIRLAGTAQSVSAATAALTTVIKLTAAPTSVTTVTAALTAPGSGVAANAQASASATAALTTSIRLASAAAAASQATADLLTSIRLSATAQSISTASGTLSSAASTMRADAVALSIASAALTTQILLQAAGNASASASGVLDGSNEVRGSLSGRPANNGSQRTNLQTSRR